MAGNLLVLGSSCAASLQELNAIQTPADLPAGTTLVCSLPRRACFSIPVRWGWQAHWLRELASGVLDGLVGVRADASAEARFNGEWTDNFVARVRGEDGRLRLQVVKEETVSSSMQGTLSAGVVFDRPLASDPAPLLGALTGQSPFALVRSIFADTGSQKWSEFASRAGLRSRVLEDLADRWWRLTPLAEPALFQLAGSPQALKEVQEWCARILNDLANPEALYHQVADWPWENLPGGTVMLDLLEGAAGAPLDAVLNGPDWTRLRSVAAEIQALLTQQPLKAGLTQLIERAAQAGIPWLERRLEELGSTGLSQLSTLARKLMERAPSLLEKKLTAELSMRASAAARDSALLDARFDFTEPGLSAFHRVLAGDWRPAIIGQPAGVEVLHAILSHQRRRRFDLELHLPFAFRRNWQSLTESLASLEIQTGPAGRTMVLDVQAESSSEATLRQHSILSVAGSLTLRALAQPQPTFRISFEDQRTIRPGDPSQPYYTVLRAYGLAQRARAWIESSSSPVEATLGIEAPGELFSAWADVPSERESIFFEAFRPVSTAVQAMLRTWLPASWFAELKQYRNITTAYPLLVYAATKPFHGRPRGQYTYDDLDDALVSRAFRSAARRLPRMLDVIHDRLVAAGDERTAAFYLSKETASVIAFVQRRRSLFDALLRSDTILVNQVADLAFTGRELRSLVQRDPAQSARAVAKFAERFVYSFRKRLRRLYAGVAFEALGSLLLVEATAALTRRGRLPLKATLHLRSDDREITLA